MNGIHEEFNPLNKPEQTMLDLEVETRQSKSLNTRKQSFVVFLYEDLDTLALINKFDEAVRNYHNGLNNGIEIKEL